MANTQNLIPLSKRTQQERKEIASKGAKASNKKQAEKKSIRELTKLLLDSPVKDKEIASYIKAYSLPKDCNTYGLAIIIAQLKKALEGNTTAFNSLIAIINNTLETDTINPNINITIEPVTATDISKEDFI